MLRDNTISLAGSLCGCALLTISLALSIGCETRQQRASAVELKAEPGAPLRAEAPRAKTTKKEAKMEAQDDKTLRARLEIDRIQGGKNLQGTYLLPIDGSDAVVLSYRPILEYLPYLEKEVLARGHIDNPPAHVQSLGAGHFVVSSIELAPGQTPHDPPLTQVPQPPWAADYAQLEARKGFWVQTRATIEEIRPAEENDSTWSHIVFTYPDGQRFRTSLSSTHRVEGNEGQEVTILGKLMSEPGEDGLLVFGSHAICYGEVRGCGMPQPGDDGRRKTQPVIGRDKKLRAGGPSATASPKPSPAKSPFKKTSGFEAKSVPKPPRMPEE